ncbi:4'-phosphopantetheinyl transferase superfamily protein [Zwartia sp.]|uniref:LpxL/LpxP family acyltransferase n=1 Tax=Zwartia sp. TaxID=2978004 RepID=UPI00271D1A99|nr:4'-phosphopantetheinyl transferase superfamily protein [Zwartia sp.]MDO9024881.1 4'-phosphopantetheinyl transferase superfamily protein [Zwartia sp.]
MTQSSSFVESASLPDGCAVDTVEIERVARLIEAMPGELDKLFSKREIEDAGEGPGRIASLAARFAAKEACLKLFPSETALNTITAMDFSVVRDAYGAPYIAVTPAAEIVLGRHLVQEINISLTHSETTATAVALRKPKIIKPSWGGQFIFRWLPYRRKVILENLNRVYGAHVDAAQIALLAQAHYGHLLSLVKELFQFRFLSVARKKSIVRVEGVAGMIEAFEAGKGILILTGHFGNFEVSTVAGIEHFPQVKGRIHFLRRPIKPKWLSDLLTRRFNQAGFGVVGRRGSLEEIVTTIEGGDAIVFPFDQYARRPEGIEVEFFGQAAGTYKSMAVIAMATGAPVIPAASWREPDGTHVLKFFPPLEPIVDDDVGQEIIKNTRAYNRALELSIIRHPEQWWWVHRRWKNQKPRTAQPRS